MPTTCLFLSGPIYHIASVSQIIEAPLVLFVKRRPKITPVEKEAPAVIRFPSQQAKLAGTVLRLDEVEFCYVPGEIIFKNVNISAGLDSRICIVSNGVVTD